MIVAVASLRDLAAALGNPAHLCHKHPVWFELRLDLDDAWLDVLANPEKSLAPLRAPGRTLIATCRRREDGGAFAASDDQRRALLRAVEPLVDFVDLELDESLDLPREKVIRSYHNLEQMPRDLETIVRGLRHAGGRYFKIAARATALCDNLRMRDLLKAEKDLAAFCMGEHGVPSRVLGEAWGSALSYASLGAAAIAPGMLTLRDMLQVYRAPDLTAQTPVYGVTGSRVGHSLSPQLHNAALRQSGLNAVYLPLAARDTADFLRFARSLPVLGASVTIPFKEEIARHCVSLDEAARASGAVNTIKIDEHGSLRGFNTDAAGFIAALEGEFGKVEPGCRFLVLGAGGSARACVHALRKAGAYVGVWARRADLGKALCKSLGAEWIAQPAKSAVQWECVVNCTPCGMRGGSGFENLPLPFEDLKPVLHPKAVLYDVVYEPALTPLTARAQAEGFKVANGLSMLLRQGEAQAAMFGYLPPNAMFQPPQRPRGRLIWLVGMRGAGKSTLAPALARELGVPAFDLDALIELRAGAPVAEIFARRGQAAFRVLEDVELSLLAARESEGVVATGGGVVENPRLIETMRGCGRVLWLDVPTDELRKRVAASPPRPSLTGGDAAAELDDVLARRKPLYQRAAHAVVDAAARAPGELAGEIARSLSEPRP